MWKRQSSLSFLFLALALAGCANAPHGAPAIDTRYRAQGQDSRVQYVILHYTDAPFEPALRILTQQEVSSHYLVSDQDPPVVYCLVDEDRRAWHAGQSSWQGATMLNSASIGIEIVNPGRRVTPDGTVEFAPYPLAQIDLVVRLVRDIVARHGIRPDRVLGHNEVAPQRKIDPGPAFPWRVLAEAGLIAWPEPSRVAAQRPRFEFALPEAIWFQRTLTAIGYAAPDSGAFDAPTRRVIAAFQMKYRPSRFDGEPDAETAALMQVLAQPLQDSDGRQ
jgi:N-acetylmuramoyl-L-alanine amidase